MRRTKGFGQPPPDKYHISITNDSDEDVPAYGLVKVVDAALPADDATYEIDKPDSTLTATFWICSPVGCASGKAGAATNRYPCPVAYDDAHTPAVGEEWGPKDGSWLLSKDGKGFRILGGVDSDNGLVRVELIGGSGGSSKNVVAIISAAFPAATGSSPSDYGVLTDVDFTVTTGFDWDTLYNPTGVEFSSGTAVGCVEIDGKAVVFSAFCPIVA